jgi:hypothetical protein
MVTVKSTVFWDVIQCSMEKAWSFSELHSTTAQKIILFTDWMYAKSQRELISK